MLKNNIEFELLDDESHYSFEVIYPYLKEKPTQDSINAEKVIFSDLLWNEINWFLYKMRIDGKVRLDSVKVHITYIDEKTHNESEPIEVPLDVINASYGLVS